MFQLGCNPFARLVLTLPDRTVHEGLPVRAFPLAAPVEGVSLVSTDGRELAWVPHLDAPPREAQSLIEHELAGLRADRAAHRGSVQLLDSQHLERKTHRGPTRFVLKGEKDIRRPRRGRTADRPG